MGEGIVRQLRSQEAVKAGGGVSLRAVYTPGHEEDHISYFMAKGRTLFTGDTILGNSSSSVRNLSQYMKSLEALAKLKPNTLCPGHGQVVHNGSARVQWYIEHRREREEQVLSAIEAGADTVERIVQAVYPRGLRRNLKGAAARNVRTHLEKLKEDGRISEDSAVYSLTGS